MKKTLTPYTAPNGIRTMNISLPWEIGRTDEISI